jgi:hypothetical protein
VRAELLLVVLIRVEEMKRWQHDRVQDANDQDLAVRCDSVEDCMLADEGAEVRRDLAKWPTQRCPVDESLKPCEEPDHANASLRREPDRRA